MNNIIDIAQDAETRIAFDCEPAELSDLNAALYLYSDKPNLVYKLNGYRIAITPLRSSDEQVLRPDTIQLDTQYAVQIFNTFLSNPFNEDEKRFGGLVVCGFNISNAYARSQEQFLGKTLDICQFQTRTFPEYTKGTGHSFERTLGFINYQAVFTKYIEQLALWLNDNTNLEIQFVSEKFETWNYTHAYDHYLYSVAAKYKRTSPIACDYEEAESVIASRRRKVLGDLGLVNEIKSIKAPDLELKNRNHVSYAKSVEQIVPIQAVQDSFGINY